MPWQSTTVTGGRWNRILDRLERLLALAERALEERVGARAEPALFERAHAFRWDARHARPSAADRASRSCSTSTIWSASSARWRGWSPTRSSSWPVCRPTTCCSSASAARASRRRCKGLLARYARARPARRGGAQGGSAATCPTCSRRSQRAPQRFLIFCDDLSFDAGEPGYRALKAALEGSLVATPANVRIVATSNRRHLLPESVADNREARPRRSTAICTWARRSTRSSRSRTASGCVLGFYAFDQDTYLEIVDHYAARRGLEAPREQVHEEALRWALRARAAPGARAKQFVDDFAGREALARTRDGARDA